MWIKRGTKRELTVPPAQTPSCRPQPWILSWPRSWKFRRPQAILRAYQDVEDDLRRRLEAAGVKSVEPNRLTATQLAGLAADKGVITEQSEESVRGLGVLRNLAAHGQREVTPAQALDYLAMVDGVLYIPATRARAELIAMPVSLGWRFAPAEIHERRTSRQRHTCLRPWKRGSATQASAASTRFMRLTDSRGVAGGIRTTTGAANLLVPRSSGSRTSLCARSNRVKAPHAGVG
jgi:hypothetical protein